MSNPSAPKTGRPPKPFLMDDDRYAVALMLMQLRHPINGKLPSLRKAAQRATIAADMNEVTVTEFGGPPPPVMSETGTRHSPTNPSFKDGYKELRFSDSSKKTIRSSVEASIKRLERKYAEWFVGGSQSDRDWLETMAAAWEAAFHPNEAIAKGLDPIPFCSQVAGLLGEEQFVTNIMIPLIKSKIHTSE